MVDRWSRLAARLARCPLRGWVSTGLGRAVCGTSGCRGQYCARCSGTKNLVIPALALVYIGAGGSLAGREGLAAQAGWCFLSLPERSASQVCQCSHQESACLVRAGLPGARIGRQLAVGHVAGLGVARRVEDALDMPAVGQHELDLATEQQRRLVAGLPGVMWSVVPARSRGRR